MAAARPDPPPLDPIRRRTSMAAARPDPPPLDDFCRRRTSMAAAPPPTLRRRLSSDMSSAAAPPPPSLRRRLDSALMMQYQPGDLNQMKFIYDFPAVPFELFPPAQPQQGLCQEFDYFLVIDFEATCDKERQPDPQEIIEFPCVIVNAATGLLESSFQTYVRPSYHLELTDFCKQLTGIQQYQVDNGVSLSEALLMHDEWLERNGIKQKKFAVVTWTDWDCRMMLDSECNLKKINKPSYFNRWINLKQPFREVSKRAHFNLQEAMKLAGLAWEGCAHNGLDDARNTARILVHLMQGGYKLSITGTITDNSVKPSVQPKEPATADSEVPEPSLTSKDKFICHCGKQCRMYTIQEPGPALGKAYLVCGAWNEMTGRSICHYRVWVAKEAETADSQVPEPSLTSKDKFICHCGKRCRLYTVQEPGPALGKAYLVCGQWNETIGRSSCHYRVWV